jgi:hypothetical protein
MGTDDGLGSWQCSKDTAEGSCGHIKNARHQLRRLFGQEDNPQQINDVQEFTGSHSKLQKFIVLTSNLDRS